MAREGWVSDYNSSDRGPYRAPGCTCSDKQIELVGCDCEPENRAPVMTVLDLIHRRFPTCSIARRDLSALQGMPLESVCGEDCAQGVNKAGDFADLMVAALGDPDLQPICDAAVRLCLVYICG